MPDLPVEIWAFIMDLLQDQRRMTAAVRIQAHFKGFKTRIGPLRWILRYIRKSDLVQTRAAYAIDELQKRGRPHTHVVMCAVWADFD